MTKIKTTNKQQKILDSIMRHGGLITAAQIKAKLSGIDLATIYRSLDKFSKANLLRKTLNTDGEAMYEYVKDKHYHLACNTCGKINHIQLPKELLNQIPALKHFKKDSIEITFRGKCK